MQNISKTSSAYELYDILRLRNEVFVVEQNCVFQDADNKDQHCYHWCGWKMISLLLTAVGATGNLL
jgi:predicted GNAT family N-acyltransferase